MKIPQTPPFLMKHLVGDGLLRALKEVALLLPKTPPDDYLHWDKIRYRPLPDGFESHEIYWKCLKLLRLPRRIPLSLVGKGGASQGFVLHDEVQRGLIDADSYLRGVSDMREPLSPAARDVWIAQSLMEDEAIHSSMLEGAATTRREAKRMLHQKRRPKSHGERMVLNNYRAMRYVREHKNDKLSEAMICELHRMITADTLKTADDAGRFRAVDDDNFGVWDNTRNRLLFRPPPVGELPGRMRALCEFANAPHQSNPFIHPVVRAIILHFQIGHDHPFVDGNGRTARALFYWLMLKGGYWLAEHTSISGIFLRAPSKYARAYLYAETDDGDLTYFILHQLRTLTRATKQMREYINARIRRIQTVRPALRKARGLNMRQIAFLEYALKHAPRDYTVREHQSYHNITPKTARTDLRGLAAAGYLEMRLQGKAHLFYPTAKLADI